MKCNVNYQIDKSNGFSSGNDVTGANLVFSCANMTRHSAHAIVGTDWAGLVVAQDTTSITQGWQYCAKYEWVYPIWRGQHLQQKQNIN